MRPDVDRSTYTTDFAADGAHAKLIWHWGARLDREGHSTTVATSLEFDWHGLLKGEEGCCSDALRVNCSDVTVTR
jgi:hypothetical protein